MKHLLVLPKRYSILVVYTGAENWEAKSIDSRVQCIRVVGRWEPEYRIRSFGAGGSVRVLLDPVAHSWTMRMLSLCSVAMEDAFLQCIQIVFHYAQSAQRLIRFLHRAPQKVSTVRERWRSLVMYHTKLVEMGSKSLFVRNAPLIGPEDRCQARPSPFPNSALWARL